MAINSQGADEWAFKRAPEVPFAVTINQWRASLFNLQNISEKEKHRQEEGKKGKEEGKKGGRAKNQYLSKPPNVQKLDLMTQALDQKNSPHCMPNHELLKL